MSKEYGEPPEQVAVVSSLPMAGEAHSGVSYYSKNLAEALARCGLAVVVLAEEGHPMRSGNPAVSSTWLPGFSYPRAIVRAVRKLKITTVLVEHTPFLYGVGPGSIFAFPVLLALLRLCGCRVVTDLHDVRPLRTIDADFTKAVGLTVPALFLRLAFKLLFGSIALCSHRLIVHDPTTARTLVEDYGARAKAVDAVALLPPTVTVQERAQAREALAIPKRARCLLFFGYASPYKGLELLSAALKELQTTGGLEELVVLVAAGPNPHLARSAEYRMYYEDLKKALSESRFVRWHGFVDDEDVGTYFGAADAVILPYTGTIGSSYPLAQAVAYGCPALVSTRIPSGGYEADITTFEPTVEEITAAIVRFAALPAGACDRRSGEASAAAITAQYRAVLLA